MQRGFVITAQLLNAGQDVVTSAHRQWSRACAGETLPELLIRARLEVDHGVGLPLAI